MIRPIRIGIVGLNFGKHLIDNLLRPENRKLFKIEAVCDINAALATAMGKKLGVKAYSNLDELLADSDIPVVGLFTGPNGRAALLRRIFQAGKDVMTTKPFETDPAAAAAILLDALNHNRVIHLNSPMPNWSPDLEQIARWRERFHLGRPIAARADVWASYREKMDDSWYNDPERCPVAPVFRIGIYLINDLVRIFGPAEEVQVIHSKVLTERPTPDNAQLGLLYKNGAIGNVFASFCVDDAQPYRNALTLNFERGTIYRNVGPKVKDRESVKLVLVTKGAKDQMKVVHRGVSSGSGGYQWRGFYNAVKRREPPTIEYIRELVEGLQIIAAMKRAEQTSASVKVAPTKLLRNPGKPALLR